MAGDWIVLSVLAVAVVLLARSLWKNRKTGCCGKCSQCNGCNRGK